MLGGEGLLARAGRDRGGHSARTPGRRVRAAARRRRRGKRHRRHRRRRLQAQAPRWGGQGSGVPAEACRVVVSAGAGVGGLGMRTGGWGAQRGRGPQGPAGAPARHGMRHAHKEGSWHHSK